MSKVSFPDIEAEESYLESTETMPAGRAWVGPTRRFGLAYMILFLLATAFYALSRGRDFLLTPLPTAVEVGFIALVAFLVGLIFAFLGFLGATFTLMLSDALKRR